jgi:hypothetical protein
MTDEQLVKQWDEYVESMGSVMGEVEHMAQQMRDRIDTLTAKVKLMDDLDAINGEKINNLEVNLTANIAALVVALRFYTCTDDGCDGCPEQGRDRVGCGWTARATLAAIELVSKGGEKT